jgi:hypothetical protein
MMLIVCSDSHTFKTLHLQENENTSTDFTISIFADIIKSMIQIIAQHNTTFFTRFKNRIIKNGETMFQTTAQNQDADVIEDNDKDTMESLHPYIEPFMFITLLQRINIAYIFRIRINGKLKTWYSPRDDLHDNPIGTIGINNYKSRTMSTKNIDVMRDIQNAIKIIETITQNSAEHTDWFLSHKESIVTI